MAIQRINDVRLAVLSSRVADAVDQQTLAAAVADASGDWAAARSNLANKLPPETIARIDLTHTLAEWTGDNTPVISALLDTPGVSSLRDVTLHFDANKLAAAIDPQTLPATVVGSTPEERQRNFAASLNAKLFQAEPSAVLQRMAANRELPIADANLSANVATVLNNLPAFNIRTTSIYTALNDANALKNIPEAEQAATIDQLKALQRVQALSPVPEVVPALMTANLTTAFGVADIPESNFLAAYSTALGSEANARFVHTTATDIRIRNEQALMSMRDSVYGSGLAIIDGAETRQERVQRLQRVTNERAVPLDLQSLFGVDYCECDECLSVYSPAAYFVELLNYLRNNNLDPKNPSTGQKGYANTPLEKLFRRRPDLGCLELTCENTYTVLPYVDLVNEVMESFIVHQGAYDGSNPDSTQRQAWLDVFNVKDETSGELLAQPQHVNYQAYCILKNAVYPFTLPYHQPIDAIRIFLKYLGTSRCELLDTFRSAHDMAAVESTTLSPSQKQALETLHPVVLGRAVDAECLGLTQEEYIILTREAFWPKAYFDALSATPVSDADYQNGIGVRPVNEYYGYASDADMLSMDESPVTGEKGLTFVKKQFLRRTGIQYANLVDLLETRFINPEFPQGKALTLLESIRFSYRYLQTFVDYGSSDPNVRYGKLIDFLIKAQGIVPALEAMLHPDPCTQIQRDRCPENHAADLTLWVRCYFERLGRLIVLDSGEGVGGAPSGGTVPGIAAVPNVARPLRGGGLDTCDLDKVRLVHLNGAPLVDEEYDRMHRFIRLWRRTSWTIDEVDKALTGAGPTALLPPITPPLPPAPAPTPTEPVSFADFAGDCGIPAGGLNSGGLPCADPAPDNWDCPGAVDTSAWKITPDFLHQLAAIRKLAEQTGLALPKLLAFWADISTAGSKSLYASLFLTHNLVSIDNVFQADKNGNYLTQPAALSDHLPVLMAAFKLKPEDIAAIVQYRKLADTLTLATASAIYRHSLLAKLLHVKPALVGDIIDLFGDPFASPQAALNLLEVWGRMEDGGFKFAQLNYLIQNRDDAARPLAPAAKTLLVTAKTLFDGLNAIDRDNPDIPDSEPDKATDALLRSQAAKLFEPAAVERIIGLLDGTTVYSTNASANLTVSIPQALAGRLKYTNQPKTSSAVLQITGILTASEVATAKALVPSDSDWSPAIDRLGAQPQNVFNDVLFGIFADVATAKLKLLADDILDPQASGYTPPAKRVYFLKYFLPFLRKQLSHRLIISTMAGVTGLPFDIAEALLADILQAGSPAQAALDALEQIKNAPNPPPPSWQGYLIPPADGVYAFAALGATQPADITVDGQALSFSIQQVDPHNVWLTDPTTPVNLKAGKLYRCELTDRTADQLSWKSSASAMTPIPLSALLPDYSQTGTAEVFAKLVKSAILVKGFKLTRAEASYWQGHAADFDGFDFNAIGLQHWKRLAAYARLRDSLPKFYTSLLDLFTWSTSLPPKAGAASAMITAATGWAQADVAKLIAANHFDLGDRKNFANEISLITLDRAIGAAKRIGIDIDRLFEWSQPGSKFWDCHLVAEAIRKAIRARFAEDEWEQVARPLNDQLRENQKQALIAYLLVQQDLIDWGVVDADSLFEFFLIDVQMGTCMETSRIKQAISSVQQFVQRGMLGLEEKYGLPNGALDRGRWTWMQKYRLWEANRKVFLYPENWIRPELRDDKSELYKALESELLQKDVSTQTIRDALKNYLFKVDEVAHLQVIGLFFDEGGRRLHIFGRTHNAPYYFYYRYFDFDASGLGGSWYPWEKMQVDVPSYDVGDHATDAATGSGSYLIPLVWNGRLLVFIPQVNIKTRSETTGNTASGTFSGGKFGASGNNPIEYTEIKLGWSEYRNGKWTQKQISKDSVSCDLAKSALPLYAFIPEIHADRVTVNVAVNQAAFALGSAPAACSSLPNRLDVFALNKDDGLWHWYSDGSNQWSKRQLLGGKWTSKPAVVSRGEGRIDVVIRGSDHALWHKAYDNGSWSGWEPLGGTFVSGPAISSLAPGRLDVFAVASDNALWHQWYENATWSNWENLGATLSSAPAAVSWSSDRIDVFARGGASDLLHTWWPNPPWTWDPSLGGTLTSAPTVASWGVGRLDVFVRGADNALWRKPYDGSWQGWDSWGGQLSRDPAAVSHGSGKIDVFACWPDDSLWQKTYDNGSWEDWRQLPPESIGAFDFVGSQLFVSQAPDPVSTAVLPDYFHFFSNTKQIHSLQLLKGGTSPELLQSTPYLRSSDATQHQFYVDLLNQGEHQFHHAFAHELLGHADDEALDALYDDFHTRSLPVVAEAYGDDIKVTYHELRRSYSLYDWEFGFHAVMQLVDRALSAQQFDLALSTIQLVFDPTALGVNAKRFWKFQPFKEIDATTTVQSLLEGLKPNQPNQDITDWRNKPFMPHVVARGRPSAYMKYVAMKYIEILIAYGDYYFRQLTLESIPSAIQCYVFASHIFGPRSQKIPKRGKILPETYLSLLDRWDAFGNAMVELELVFPFSNQISTPLGNSNGVVGLANIFGFATSLYFCIPENPQLRALRDTIDNRLFKIRHCQDINGVFHKLPLFEPPIDPALLVEAAAQGVSLASVLNDLDSPMPNYRFYYLLQKAFELCNEVKSLGGAFLAAKEKGDAEALALLRAQHESAIQSSMMEVKKAQLDEARKSLDALQQSRIGIQSRMEYYLKLIGEDLTAVPASDADFNEVENQIEQPISDSGLKLIAYEKEEIDASASALFAQTAASQDETTASLMSMIPTFSINAQPFGVGSSVSFGGSNMAAASQATARVWQMIANGMSYNSNSAARKAGFLRQMQERIQQANAAGYELKNIDKQMLTQQIRIAIASKEIDIQQQQIDDAAEVEDFLNSKYSNQELYAWMEGEVRSLHYQAYTLAYDLAKRSEKLYRFERGLSSSNFVQYGYWDAGRDGLMSGERLYVSLKQLEAAYQEKRGYDFEISASFSLRQTNPLALLQLRETGACEFALPEILFDMVRPGDYQRRIKSVSLSMPCVVGPYTSPSCTLRLLEHKFRTSAIATSPDDYVEKIGEADDRFSTVSVPITAIATSSGASDSGVFELNFRDERYLPFEGAGAISKWRLELPAALRQFDYDTITDLIIQLRYTALDGGSKLCQTAGSVVTNYVKTMIDLSRDEGLFAVIDLRRDLPTAWYKAMQPATSPIDRALPIDGIMEMLPVFAQGHDPKTIVAKDVYLFSSLEIISGSPNLNAEATDFPFLSDSSVGTLFAYAMHDVDAPLLNWVLQLPGIQTPMERLWMVFRYIL